MIFEKRIYVKYKYIVDMIIDDFIKFLIIIKFDKFIIEIKMMKALKNINFEIS